jgi:hypothetical protein
MIREIIDAFKNWLRDEQPRLIPIPVRKNEEKAQRNFPDNNRTDYKYSLSDFSI